MRVSRLVVTDASTSSILLQGTLTPSVHAHAGRTQARATDDRPSAWRLRRLAADGYDVLPQHAAGCGELRHASHANHLSVFAVLMRRRRKRCRSCEELFHPNPRVVGRPPPAPHSGNVIITTGPETTREGRVAIPSTVRCQRSPTYPLCDPRGGAPRDWQCPSLTPVEWLRGLAVPVSCPCRGGDRRGSAPSGGCRGPSGGALPVGSRMDGRRRPLLGSRRARSCCGRHLRYSEGPALALAVSSRRSCRHEIHGWISSTGLLSEAPTPAHR